jgi:CRP-like cAMP-binding protein
MPLKSESFTMELTTQLARTTPTEQPIGIVDEGMSSERAAQAMELPHVFIPAGRVLFWQDDHQQQKIEIVNGVVRAVRLLENGSRQILAFYWPGDTFYPAAADMQCYTAEAVTMCRVRYSNDRACSSTRASGTAQVLNDMLALVLAIGKKATVPRIAWFLLRVREHLPRDPRRHGSQQILLPRADMADYLGTSIETICRTLHDFDSKGLISLPTRKTIRFLDLTGLERIAEA